MNLPLFKFQSKLVWDENSKKWLSLLAAKTTHKSVYATDAEAIANGNKAFQAGRFEDAIVCYSEAALINPINIDAFYNLGVSKEKLKRYIEAVVDYSKAIVLNPLDAVAHNNRGSCNHALKKYIEANADYSEAIRLNPQEAVSYINRGNTRKSLHEYTEAIIDFSEAIRLNPKAIFVHIDRGNAYFALGRIENAIEDYCLALPFSMGLRSSNQNYSPIDEVFKFRTVNYNSLNSLKNREIWFAQSRTFNDVDDGEYLRKLFPDNKSISDLLGKILMHSCFGNNFSSQNIQHHQNEMQQMWAHYGAESAGICLHFKYSPEAAQKGNLFMLDSVKYSGDIKFDENQSQYDVIRHGFFTKSTAWKSENEYRFITMASDKTVRSEDGRCIGQLANEIDLGLTLSAVEFGARCSADDILKVKDALMQRGDGASIKLYQVKLGTAEDPFRWSKNRIL